MMLHKSINSKGFTLIELLIATAVFSVILLVATAGLMNIGNTYYKGYISTQTQHTARSLLNDISQTIEFGGDIQYNGANNPAYLCVGSVRYTFTYDHQLATDNLGDHSTHVVLRDIPSSCGAAISTPNTELMSSRTRLQELDIVKVGSTNVYSIKVRVIYGDNDVINQDNTSPGYHKQCISGVGQQYCQVAELTTSIQQRISKS